MRISDWSSDVCSSDLFGDILSREIDLCPRLQDQPLGDALVIIAFEPPEQIALVRQEQRAFGFEPVRRESFEADRRIAAVWPFAQIRSEEHTSELQSLMRNSHADFCLKKKNKNK